MTRVSTGGCLAFLSVGSGPRPGNPGVALFDPCSTAPCVYALRGGCQATDGFGAKTYR